MVTEAGGFRFPFSTGFKDKKGKIKRSEDGEREMGKRANKEQQSMKKQKGPGPVHSSKE